MEEFKAKQSENQVLEKGLAERSMWLMKCPSLVARSFQSLPIPDNPYPHVANVILSIDTLATEDEETKFVMELARAESGNMPRGYTLDMSKDFIPMSVFCESSEGNMSVEGKIKNKFDMKPHNENIESYGKLCRERTNRYMGKNRQIQVLVNMVQSKVVFRRTTLLTSDRATSTSRGMHMRPMPGMIIPTANPEKKKLTNRTSEMKRTRRDRGEMEEVMFNLFERQ